MPTTATEFVTIKRFAKFVGVPYGTAYNWVVKFEIVPSEKFPIGTRIARRVSIDVAREVKKLLKRGLPISAFGGKKLDVVAK